MKLIKTVLITISLFLSTFSYSAVKIEAKEAPFYTGEEVIACGQLMQITRFKRGVYLNLEAVYPKQPLTFVLWEDDIAPFQDQNGSIQSLINKRLCGKGKVTEYKGRSQISLYNMYSLKVDH
ncbi:putative exported protein [Aliivibrio wodanis]|uniref:Putative exported protein n=1 Tax=Aliivibrio wodanis TaxID=80852 RepID=A0A090I6Q8_9GAMM|nr:putative exported protein [Aliivibrio wodanis]